jgi:hypothetical protein
MERPPAGGALPTGLGGPIDFSSGERAYREERFAAWSLAVRSTPERGLIFAPQRAAASCQLLTRAPAAKPSDVRRSSYTGASE